MSTPGLRTFVHRHNADGTIDSICRECYVTVCSSFVAADLGRAEQCHICDPAVLAYWARFAKPDSAKPESPDSKDQDNS